MAGMAGWAHILQICRNRISRSLWAVSYTHLKFYQRERQGLIMEAEKLNNGNRKSGSCEAGFFYRRIGGTVYKIRVLTSENSTDTVSYTHLDVYKRQVEGSSSS